MSVSENAVKLEAVGSPSGPGAQPDANDGRYTSDNASQQPTVSVSPLPPTPALGESSPHPPQQPSSVPSPPESGQRLPPLQAPEYQVQQHAWHPSFDGTVHSPSTHPPPTFQAAVQAAVQHLQQHQQHPHEPQQHHWHSGFAAPGTPVTSATGPTPTHWHAVSNQHPTYSPPERRTSRSPSPGSSEVVPPSVPSTSTPPPSTEQQASSSSTNIEGQPIISNATGGNVARFPSNMKPKPSTTMKAVPDPEDPNFAIITEVRDERTGKTRKMFRCAYPGCAKVCNRLYNLKSHVLVHTNNRPFQCDHCAMSFARRHDLQRHLRSTHQKQKAFVCDRCGLSFTRADAYRRHLIVEEKKRTGVPMTAEELQFEAATHAAAAAAAAAAVVAGGNGVGAGSTPTPPPVSGPANVPVSAHYGSASPSPNHHMHHYTGSPSANVAASNMAYPTACSIPYVAVPTTVGVPAAAFISHGHPHTLAHGHPLYAMQQTGTQEHSPSPGPPQNIQAYSPQVNGSVSPSAS
ncbi:hypothetical protein SpCBS45565_g08437 [Spizellomyces sp. 'palustris']|nr:hypothetical protein SpCBS45565_g08437 [Spizellomyces sp. 'palustris']